MCRFYYTVSLRKFIQTSPNLQYPNVILIAPLPNHPAAHSATSETLPVMSDYVYNKGAPGDGDALGLLRYRCD